VAINRTYQKLRTPTNSRKVRSMRIAPSIVSLLLVVGIWATPSYSRTEVAVGISVRVGPPVLPVYVQPICPGPGYIWVPGYWAYGPDGYFWVPGTWVVPPEIGLLWTPGYWGWEDGFYRWHVGYWGPKVGFYGGINYGFGYTGVGFFGGYWSGHTFYYNRAVTNVNVTVARYTFNKTVNGTTRSRVSFNGGRGGINARPTAEQEKFARERHIGSTAVQRQLESAARSDRNQFASVNHGHSIVAATPKPGEFKGPGIVQAKTTASHRMTTTRSEPRSAAKPGAESTTRTENKSRTEAKTEAKPRTETKPTATHESKTEAKPRTETKPAATHESKTEAKPRTETKPAATHESKTEAKPRTETKPA
jgi:WXXGXW repeat (2 copies)